MSEYHDLQKMGGAEFKSKEKKAEKAKQKPLEATLFNNNDYQDIIPRTKFQTIFQKYNPGGTKGKLSERRKRIEDIVLDILEYVPIEQQLRDIASMTPYERTKTLQGLREYILKLELRNQLRDDPNERVNVLVELPGEIEYYIDNEPEAGGEAESPEAIK